MYKFRPMSNETKNREPKSGMQKNTPDCDNVFKTIEVKHKRFFISEKQHANMGK